MKRGTCVICGTTKTQFIKAQKGESLLNKAIKNLPFEMHLPGHNFMGLGTKLKKRLNPDLTPKKWSKPVNRVDKAAYHHDVYYLKMMMLLLETLYAIKYVKRAQEHL